MVRTLVGQSASEITARLLDAGTAVAKVVEHRELHPLARAKISIKDIVYFMEQIENTLFLGMEPRLALKACAITLSAKSKSGKNLRLVAAEMERLVAGGESLASAARQFPNLFNQVAVGLLEAGEGSGSLDESLRSIRILVARSESIRHQTSMMILQPAITLLVNRLAERGWLRRTPDPLDGRAVLVELTADGCDLLDRLRAEFRALVHEEMAMLDDEDIGALARAVEILDGMIERLEDRSR